MVTGFYGLSKLLDSIVTCIKQQQQHKQLRTQRSQINQTILKNCDVIFNEKSKSIIFEVKEHE